MKILYSVQATGNGHISRAMELLPYLQNYGTVDLFLSGDNSTLNLDAPIKYRSKGLSLFYTCKGSLDHWKFASHLAPLRMYREARDLPVEKYDLVLNDFDSITSMACAMKKVPSIHFGHQASFFSPRTPRPEKKSLMGEWILRYYARASKHIGLHFQCYDTFILSPVIKDEILAADPSDNGYVTVYLPSYCEPQLKQVFSAFKDHRFEIFSVQSTATRQEGNITWHPVGRKQFNKSLINCHALVTGAGFETPAEALHLKKKLIAIPIRAQYEQQCNAAALKAMGVPVTEKLDGHFNDLFLRLMSSPEAPSIFFPYSNAAIVEWVMQESKHLAPVEPEAATS